MGDQEERQRAAAVFDALGADYEKAFAHSRAHHASLEWLLERLGPDSRVLDVGSGTGRPTAAALAAAGHRVLGLDISPVMVELATRQVPDAEFRCADVRDLAAQEGAFDAACAYFSLLQMPRREQAAVVGGIARVVAPGGPVVLATVPLDVEEVDAAFMGQPVRVTSFGASAFAALAAESGLVVESRESVLFTPAHPEAVPEPHLFLHCRRSGAARP
ncbi:class I SAM-dependent methyltransferase [Streptomyces tropicalis]|uniref:Class I SAM-dependent methyltransferase n=1 Tax=Streptomyces tropicalis TaxID=3034234 RepID=A0ABT6A3H7_9ACTN|nr:class I SAM-dependent methyltransferase [Streptomyces tropicalis]MDF3299198.1 class I SAM-dependent methyltransferase [Streptomyces tropicalis]